AAGGGEWGRARGGGGAGGGGRGPPQELDVLRSECGGGAGAEYPQHREDLLVLERHRAREVEVSMGAQKIVVELRADQLPVGHERAANEDAPSGQRPYLPPAQVVLDV